MKIKQKVQKTIFLANIQIGLFLRVGVIGFLMSLLTGLIIGLDLLLDARCGLLCDILTGIDFEV